MQVLDDAAAEAAGAAAVVRGLLRVSVDPWFVLARGDLVPILPEWSEELYPLYVQEIAVRL